MVGALVGAWAGAWVGVLVGVWAGAWVAVALLGAASLAFAPALALSGLCDWASERPS